MYYANTTTYLEQLFKMLGVEVGMTPNAQRIAIAEACGWKQQQATQESPVEKGGMRLPNHFAREPIIAWTHIQEPGVYAILPNYLHDLNAMHEAEESLSSFNVDKFLVNLAAVVTTKYCILDWALSHATATQRAEAFLRTVGKWDDSK